MTPEKEKKLQHVLVIDDSKIDRFIVEKLIERSQLAESVVQKELAREGLDYIRECIDNDGALPRVIFLDINMPEMSGFDFLEEFIRFPESVVSYSAVVMLSSSLNEDDYKKAMSYTPVKMYCNKPINAGKLEELTLIVAELQQQSITNETENEEVADEKALIDLEEESYGFEIDTDNEKGSTEEDKDESKGSESNDSPEKE